MRCAFCRTGRAGVRKPGDPSRSFGIASRKQPSLVWEEEMVSKCPLIADAFAAWDYTAEERRREEG